MDRPTRISSEKVMRWNADVERRRRAYHERRCAEDPIYKRVYDRQQEMLQRAQKMNSVAMAQLTNVMGEAEETKCRQATDQTNVGDEPKRVRSHEEVMREQSVLRRKMDYFMNGPFGASNGFFSAGMLAILFPGPENEQFVKEMEEELPRAEEIRKADREFDEELIRMSGFEW